MAKYTAIVLAAGKGSRMGSVVHKQYLMLAGRPVIYYALKAFSDSPVDEIVLVTGEGEEEFCRKEVVERYGLRKITHITAGGSERYHSVYCGLQCCEDSDYVLIHDGARPCVSREIISRSMEMVTTTGACIAAVPVKDTIKKADADGVVQATPDRSSLWSVQTPQAFAYPLIRSAYDRMLSEGAEEITDDAMVVERYGKKQVHILEGSYRNLKITTPEDLQMAELLMLNSNEQIAVDLKSGLKSKNGY